MSLLEQDNTRKGRLDKNMTELDIGNDNSEEYKVKAIWDSAVYLRESKSGHLPSLYYLVSWKRYPEEENTLESASVAQHFRKFISFFHKDYLDKPTATSPAIDNMPPMARLTVRLTVKLPSLPNKSEDNQPIALINKLKRNKLRLI